jgi:hypothetical protein
MAATCWRRRFRKAIPLAIVAGVLSVLAASLVPAVRAARRAADAAATT